MATKLTAVTDDLRRVGASDQVIAEAERSIERNFPDKTYQSAVIFLGIATILLAIGGIVLAYNGKSTDGFWAVVGAGVGGLAGIFKAK